MASHHHHHCQPPPSTTSSCYCYHYSNCYTAPPPPDPHLHSPPPPFHNQDNPPPHPHLTPPHQPFHHHNHTPHHPPQTHRDFHHQTQPTVSSLLSRIAALESSILRRQYSSNSASPTSLRDAAARTIQTHFRAFLVRRSRTLRQLKDLASVKSALNALKASSNQNAHLDCQMISRRAMSLLLKLDSMQVIIISV